MKYNGSYPIFDLSKIRTYPLKSRENKLGIAGDGASDISRLGGWVDVDELKKAPIRCSNQPWFRNGLRGDGADQSKGLRELAAYTVKCYREKKPVVVISGAHPIKNGQNPIIIDLINRGIVTLYATNGAGTIHMFEYAIMGASSEEVRKALPKGDFGMAFETGAYINYALRVGHTRGYGYGECMGRLLCDAEFRKTVLNLVFKENRDTGEYYKPYDGFAFESSSIFAAAYKKSVPVTIHAMMGTDIIDQHPSFNGEIKGATSGADFLIFTEEMGRFINGGVVLNFGTAIMGPEVVLKAVSMVANVGKKPDGLWAGDFDVRPFVFDDKVRAEDQYYYYLRDQKSIATRIPKVFGGTGFYFQGMHKDTLIPFYQILMEELEENVKCKMQN